MGASGIGGKFERTAPIPDEISEISKLGLNLHKEMIECDSTGLTPNSRSSPD